jgi:HK97 family phage prohead protease
MNTIFQTKSVELSIKDLDAQTRRVKVALSKFGNVDADNDIITFGAFKKSIEERGADSTSNRKIKFLRYHDFEHEIGKWLSLEETKDHLIGVGELGRSTKGNDAFLDYQDGIITEHSIGFNIIPNATEILPDGIRVLKELFLWEGSAVTFGSNSETIVFNVSKGEHEEYLERLNKKMTGLINALKNGKGTDDRLFQIEADLRVCQQKYNSLINMKQPIQTTEEVEQPNQIENQNNLINFYQNLK